MPARTAYVALLRAVNVGGRNAVPMGALRAMADDLGFEDPRTLLQSGNLVFRSAKPHATIAALVEAEVRQRYGAAIDVIVRSAADWQRLIDHNPFVREAVDDPSRLAVMCCKDAPASAALAKLEAAIVGRECARAVGTNVYLTYPDGQGTSRLTNAVIERCLATRGTVRNWNTVTKIAALLAPG
jgi:uncharacterized protein (DUF1697 family)